MTTKVATAPRIAVRPTAVDILEFVSALSELNGFTEAVDGYLNGRFSARSAAHDKV